MSKRRSRSNTKISEETLERARQQAAETTSGEDDEQAAPAARVEPVAPRARASASSATRRGSAASQSLRKRKIEDKMSPDVVADILAHPTKEVTEDELRQHYNYVIADLRSMALLAAGLMVALVVLAQILPR